MKLLVAAAVVAAGLIYPAPAGAASCYDYLCEGDDGSSRNTERTWDERQDLIDQDRHGRTINQDHDQSRSCTYHGYC